MTSSVVFDTLNIDVEITTYPHQIALEKLRNGEISAMMRASGKPVSVIKEITTGEPFHLLGVPASPLAGVYVPTVLDVNGYPALIAPDSQVETVAIANALISDNWPRDHPRGKTLARFSERLVIRYDQLLQSGCHESWGDIDISLEIPGMPRYWAVDDMLRAIKQ